MVRVRGFTQDDSHIFCTPEQLQDEVLGLLDLMDYLLKAFGYEYVAYLATRPTRSTSAPRRSGTSPPTRCGRRSRSAGLPYEMDEGGGAFYAPKIDVKLRDALGREWQCPTIQVDLNLPKRFGVDYTGPDGKEHEVIMLHRALLGSLERFVGIFIEHTGGEFPVWLAPDPGGGHPGQREGLRLRGRHGPAAPAPAACGSRPTCATRRWTPRSATPSC